MQGTTAFHAAHKAMKKELFRTQLEGWFALGKRKGLRSRSFKKSTKQRWFCLCRTNLFYMTAKPNGSDACEMGGCLPLHRITNVEDFEECGLLLHFSMTGAREDQTIAMFAASEV